MADLAGSATGFRNAFEKYVAKNPHWTKKLEYEIEKKIKDQPYFDARGKMIDTISEGAKITIVEQRVHNKKMPGDRTAQKYAKIKVGRKTGFIKLKAIRKPTGRANVMLKEEAAISALNKELSAIGYPVDIKVKKTKGSGYYTFDNVVSCGNVAGTPKADFTLVNDKGRNICFISHKAAGGANAFQQYSGVSKHAGLNIYEHEEVQSFLHHVVAFIEDEKLQNPLMIPVTDKKLICLSIYGPNYGSAYGEDNCHLIGQGDPILTQDKKKKDCYYLTWSDGHHTNGDTKFKNGYVPHLAAVYKAGRGFVYDGTTHRGARIGITPKAFAARRTGLIIL